MTFSSRFDAISPLDSRFYGGDAQLYAALHPYLSEEGRVRAQAKAEAALARALAEEGIAPEAAAEAIAESAERIGAAEVYAEEARIGHDVRALVNLIRAKVPEDARRFVHLGATSMDVVDTANAWRYREAVDRVLLPRLGLLASRLIALAEGESDTAQAGRTHGQHAVPITFGFAVAEYVSRLGNRILFLRWAAHSLPGKLSGAVGAYNAPSLLVTDPRALERRYLAQLGLVPASHSTQIVEPEAWSDLAHACVTALGVMANLADDMRHLQRTEIAEIAEGFRREQVGSSTMPQKRNPVSFENVKSIWKAFMPRVITTYLDQISEHQRDLTNSASQRFSGELLAATAYAATRLGASIDGIRIDRDRMKANVGLSKGGIIAEALYVLLAKHGHHDAHEAVRRLTLEADRSGKGMLELAALDPDLKPLLASLAPDERRVLDQPEEYRGLAADVARDVATVWRARLAGILPE
ncbi:MAG TPA: lyase family protein [Candidatus Saccharimonadales bacterium]|nr:lyase family protein [Candidatus Saccharimonadales bacterium]